MVNINDKIKARRLELGLTDTDTSKKVGLSINHYFDVELYDDEIPFAVELRNVKKICEILGLDFFDLFGLRCAFCEECKPYFEDYLLPRNELIRKKMNEINIPTKQLEDVIGVKRPEVAKIEEDPNYLESRPIEYIKDLSDLIKIPIQILANIKCQKCGR